MDDTTTTTHEIPARPEKSDFRPIIGLEDLLASDQPFDVLIGEAVRLSASDLFVTVCQDSVRIALRRMGTVQQCGHISKEFGLRLVSHIKATAGMDVTRSPSPQDGRITVDTGGRTYIDVRLSIIPTLHGEDLAMRILDREKQKSDLHTIGFHPTNMHRLTSMISKPGGLILVTGPTDMGKTTTLYACLKFLNDGSRKIHTLEDPIEYTLDGIHQSQVNLRRGVDFPDLLRGILRQSPDVIMVGEVRDAPTAEIVVRAANSGQLVFATAHASTTVGACQNLIVLGVKPQFIATSLLGIITQRLVRTLCPFCKIPLDPYHWDTSEDVSGEGGPENNGGKRTIFTPAGCPECHNTGYIGRTAVGEVLRTTSEIRRLIQQGGASMQIFKTAMEQGMIDLSADAQYKVDHGITSPDEIIRVIPSEYRSKELDM